MAALNCSASTVLRPHCRFSRTIHFSRVGVCAGARRRSCTPVSAQRINAGAADFAATVAPDVAEEGASPQSPEQVNNRATKQQSSGASHVKPCYPTKTINCSDGMLLFPSQ